MPEEAINYILDQKLVSNDSNEIAKFILTTEGVSKKALGKFFSEGKEINKKILKSFIGLINFQGTDIDKALRLLFNLFEIPRDPCLI